MDVDDFKTRVLVLEYVYGFLEDLGVERSGDDCGFDSFAGEKLSHVKSWYHVAISHVREEHNMELMVRIPTHFCLALVEKFEKMY